MARRPVTHKASVYKIGHDYSVQPAGRESIARIKVLDLRQERLGQITHQDAKAEGYRNVALFKVAWIAQHAWRPEWDEDTPTDEELLALFEHRFAHKLVTVITFELTHDTPRFLAQPGPNQGDYTEQRHRAIDDLEVIDIATQARYSKTAEAFCIGRQIANAKKAAERSASSPRGLQRYERGRSLRDAA